MQYRSTNNSYTHCCYCSTVSLTNILRCLYRMLNNIYSYSVTLHVDNINE